MGLPAGARDDRGVGAAALGLDPDVGRMLAELQAPDEAASIICMVATGAIAVLPRKLI